MVNALIYIRDLVKRYSLLPEARIGIAAGLSGFSQIAMIFIPTGTMEIGSLADLILWQSLSAGFGIFISGVIGILAFSVFVVGDSKSDGAKFSSMLLNIFTVVFFIGIALTIICIFVFDVSIVFYAISLFVSLFLYLFATIQRGFYSARGYWAPLSAQFALDGALRTTAVIYVTWKFEGSVTALIAVSLLSQLISIVLVSIWSPWWTGISKRKIGIANFVKQLMPLTSTTLGSLLLTTFPPVLLELAGSPPLLVASVGIVVVIARIPTTLLSPVVFPQIRQVCKKYLDGEARAGFSVFNQTNIKLALNAMVTFAIMWLSITSTPQIQALDSLSKTLEGLGLVTRTLLAIFALLLVLESFANSCVNGQGRFLESGRIYLYSSMAWISILIVTITAINESLMSTILVLVFGTALVLIQLIIRLFPVHSNQSFQ
jgi:hypothetical protein